MYLYVSPDLRHGDTYEYMSPLELLPPSWGTRTSTCPLPPPWGDTYKYMSPPDTVFIR